MDNIVFLSPTISLFDKNLKSYEDMLYTIDYARATCTNRPLRQSDKQREILVKEIAKIGHHSLFEHVYFSFSMVISRAMLAQLTRHRLASYSVESQRWCNYEVYACFIYPVQYGILETPLTFGQLLRKTLEMDRNRAERVKVFAKNCKSSYLQYLELLELGAKPEEARYVLNNAFAVHLLMTCNLRELMWILRLRSKPNVFPEFKYVVKLIKKELKNKYPVFAEVIENEDVSD